MKNQAFLNDKDIWLEYKANLIKGAYSTLTGSLQAKDVVTNTSRLENGDRVVVDTGGIRYKSREFTISIAVEGESRVDTVYNFYSLVDAFTSKIAKFKVTRLETTFNLVFREVSDITDYKVTNNRYLRTAKFKLLEPDPTNRG